MPLFEIKRNQANLKSLREIQDGLEEPNEFKFVELSPSPKITEEAKQRGYDGRDSIFVYTKNKNGEVDVKQHWFKATDINEYTALLEKLGIKRGNRSSSSYADRRGPKLFLPLLPLRVKQRLPVILL